MSRTPGRAMRVTVVTARMTSASMRWAAGPHIKTGRISERIKVREHICPLTAHHMLHANAEQHLGVVSRHSRVRVYPRWLAASPRSPSSMR